MLVITRKIGERITIADEITVSVIEIKGAQVKLGIDAPRSISVHRKEIYEKISRQNMEASTISKSDFESAIAISQKTIK